MRKSCGSLPVQECIEILEHSEYMKTFRGRLFRRIVPTVRDIGLWGPRVQQAFTDMRAMEFADVNAAQLLENDNRVADEFGHKDADARRSGVGILLSRAAPRPSFDIYLHRWGLIPDGEPITTRAAQLLPVRRRAEAAMLKLSVEEEERLGGVLLEWWDGDGAAAVLARDDTALLMERAMGRNSLAEMARSGRDDETCRILCAVAARLHSPRTRPLPELIPLAHWFQALEPAALAHGGILTRCAETARQLLAEPRELGVLHGDLHHDNVLDFGARGWLAIDPKRLVGERGFDFANIFTNPDLADPARPVATEPARFLRRLNIVAEAASLERKRLLRWILAWTGLSAAWFLGDGDPAMTDLRIAELAAAELDR